MKTKEREFERKKQADECKNVMIKAKRQNESEFG